MKQFIIPIASGIIGIIIPVAGMTITPTRDLILGLVPGEAILQLADEIDQNKIDNEDKIQELQLTIESQQIKIAEQQTMIDEQNNQINSTKTESQTIQNQVNNESECRKLYSAYPECSISNKIYRTRSDFDDYMDEQKERDKKSVEICKTTGGSSKKCEDNNKSNFDKYEDKFEKCQEIIKRCG
jgi:hypothetical protein